MLAKIQRKAAHFFNMPAELTNKMPKIEITGFQLLQLENYGELSSFSKTEIIFKADLSNKIRILGQSLSIQSIQNDTATITGSINKVEYSNDDNEGQG